MITLKISESYADYTSGIHNILFLSPIYSPYSGKKSIEKSLAYTSFIQTACISADFGSGNTITRVRGKNRNVNVYGGVKTHSAKRPPGGISPRPGPDTWTAPGIYLLRRYAERVSDPQKENEYKAITRRRGPHNSIYIILYIVL